MNYEDLGIFGLLPENDDRDLYLILHGGIGWWCANGCGYTTSTDDAGVYTREVAEAQARCRYEDVAVSVHDPNLRLSPMRAEVLRLRAEVAALNGSATG